MGGVIGRSRSFHKDLGQPSVVEVLGMAVRDGHIANLRDASIPLVETLAGRPVPPVVVVSGTCMNAGKTVAATELVRGLARSGLRVAAAKLTGVIAGRQGPLGLVEAPDGIGYILKPGDALGDGRVLEIGKDSISFAVSARPGQPATTVTLRLRTD
jgi:hypothetical protein